MSEYVCPLCGGKTIKKERFCRGCQQIAKHSTPDILEEKQHPKTETITTRNGDSTILQTANEEFSIGLTPKQGVPRKLIVTMLAMLCAIILGAFVYQYLENKSLDKEKAFWLECIDQNTSFNYSDYLQRYPDGMFSITAEERIRELKNLELIEWNNLRVSNDLDAFVAYLQEYPNTPHISEIRNRIDVLAWEMVLKENSADSYRSYIENVDLGNYIGGFKDLAAKKYEYLNQLETLEGKDRDAIIRRVNHILRSLAKKDTAELKNILDDHPQTFFRIRGLEKAQLIDSLKQIYGKEKAKATKFTIIKEETSVIRDVNNTYFVSTSALEHKGTKSAADTLNFELELNRDLRIVNMDKKQRGKN